MFPDSALLLAATLLGAFLAIAVLLRVAHLQRAHHALRLLAEQALAAERGAAAQFADLRVAMERRLGGFAARTARDHGETRVRMEQKLREMADAQARHMAELTRGVNETLHQAVETQMQSSFARVLEQFAAVQKAVGDVQAVAAQVGDLKRIFANVKTRGGWGEAQLRALLDDLLPDGYVANARLAEDSAETVEFALRLPGRGDTPKLLPVDAKFPLADYERLLLAAEEGDAEAERTARRQLEARLRLEARKIAEKYLHPPLTTDFAVLYLPTDGLYAEVARVPGLIDDIGRLHVLVMGPSLLPALLRTVRLGYVTLALEEKAGQIGRLLGAVRQEMLRMDDVLEKLARGAGSMGKTIEEARRRTRAVGRHLRDVDLLNPDEADSMLELEQEGQAPSA
ncbi:MAG TPA: DNA recombination protein RmuC [Acetobacteraceae bacterium]|nr:DNA recombination protein RmuC [Acetobacteraceae bacterium]